MASPHRSPMPVLWLLVFGALAAAIAAPGGAAACDLKGPDVGCSGSAGPCDASAGGNAITTTHAHVEADCQGGGAGPHCHVEASVGQVLPPDEEHGCAF